MQLAAGELVRTTPAVGEEEYGSWREWIDGAFGADPWITSRLRRPVPLDVLSKVEAGASRPQTEIEISGHNDPWLVLASHWSAYEGRSLRLSVSVDSAVVPAELAGSLAVALLSYERRFDYALPRVELSYRLDLGEVVRILADETIDLRQENTISDGDFHLTPWYVAWSSERSEHSTDSEWPASTRLLYLPGERFLRRFSAYLDTGSLDAIANGTRIAQPHAWVYSGDYTSEHSGTRLCVERSSMAGYLSECEAVLIVEASVEDGESEQREIFILNSEGELSSMGTRQVERPRSY